jgi:hypothetical protein
MTPDQIRIVEWLKEEVPTLYPAFEKPFSMDGGDFPGRSNLVCHACQGHLHGDSAVPLDP